eukprot:5205488-Prymnesium_polylepis.1
MKSTWQFDQTMGALVSPVEQAHAPSSSVVMAVSVQVNASGRSLSRAAAAAALVSRFISSTTAVDGAPSGVLSLRRSSH